MGEDRLPLDLAERLDIAQEEVADLLNKAPRAHCAYASVTINYDWGAWLGVDPASGEGYVEVYNYSDIPAGPELSKELRGVTTREGGKQALLAALRERCDDYAMVVGEKRARRKDYKVTFMKGFLQGR